MKAYILEPKLNTSEYSQVFKKANRKHLKTKFQKVNRRVFEN